MGLYVMYTRQYYEDNDGNGTTFEDKREHYWSSKVKPEDIVIFEGSASSEEIADDINYWKAKAAGRTVGWKR